MKEVYTLREHHAILHPLCHQIEQRYHPQKTVIIGIQGGQGTGKTTLSNFLKQHLIAHGFRVQSFSIDDFYTSYRERQQLQQKYPNNPFYAIARGLPGTHRVKLLREILRKAKRGEDFTLPVFDKSLHHGAGDISKKSIPVKGRQDFILFEGWCLGLPTVSSKELIRISDNYKLPLRTIDQKLVFHKAVLKNIRPYQPLWKFIDYFIMLKPDSSSLHLRWRRQQERELRQKTGKGMKPQEIQQFVVPYLPFTYVCYEKVRPEVLLRIDEKHRLYPIAHMEHLKHRKLLRQEHPQHENS
ncbi:hypothetical protein HYU22_03610 [Candidatus Woesearchaeota archaeon]|nr:hypothetical protein [Candidatus Woesearchaeota archaeon]